jgi:ribosome-associated translation inhibitor RaiA
MQVQVNSNQSIQTHDALERWVTTELHSTLDRFKNDITRIEVHLSDENSDKASDNHMRCMVEARLARHQPLAVNHQAASLDEAFRGACEKIKRSLDHTLGKHSDHRARQSIRRDTDPEVI